MYPCTYVNFSYCIIKAETPGVITSWAKNKRKENFNPCIYSKLMYVYTWLSLILSTNRHTGKTVCPVYMLRRAEPQWEQRLSWRRLRPDPIAASPAGVPCLATLLMCSRSYGTVSRRGHLTKHWRQRADALTVPSHASAVCLVDKLSAEAWCDGENLQQEQYWRVYLPYFMKLWNAWLMIYFLFYFFT